MSVKYEWLIRPPSRQLPEEIVGHVVHRLATVIRKQTEDFRGVRVHGGHVVMASFHQGRLISGVCGIDEKSGALAIRISAAGGVAPVVSLGTFALLSVSVFLVWSRTHEGVAGALGALILGTICGAIAAFIAYRTVVKKNLFASLAEKKSHTIVSELAADLHKTLGAASLNLESGAVHFSGYDADSGTKRSADDERRWTERMNEVVGELA